MLNLTVNDLKQVVYCPRIVYYHYVMPVDKKPTYKMEHGAVAEGVIERLETRRKLKRFGINEGKRLFHQWISSPGLGLSGKVDMLITTQDAIYPVDFKYTEGRPHKNHIYQLCGYALILEDIEKRNVEKGFIYLIPQEDAVVCDLSSELKTDALKMMEDVRTMVEKELIPEPPPNRNKCADCEYKNYCGDVF